MSNILSKYIDQFQKHHRNNKRYIAILAFLAIATFIVVNWQLHQTGISMTADYQCGYSEHTHTDDCYTKVLICGKEETDGSEGHTHTDDCYEEQKELNCPKEEHTHDESCYDEDGNLTCDKEEHTHSDECYTTEKVLICGKEESEKVEAHHHTDECYEKKLTCKLPEHTHTVECLSNEKADVETSSDWEKTLPSDLTEDTAANVVAVAKSQLGYKESTKNFKLADDGKTKKGYTRYGAWYGDEYGDWSAMFAAFVYHYAGISKKMVPVNSGAHAWTVDLKKAGLYKTANDYSPAAGDLVFFDTDNDGKADQVGVVEKVTDKKITTIEGDSENKVQENSYKVSDGTIIGYCALTKEESFTEVEETKETEETKATETTETTSNKVNTLENTNQAKAVSSGLNLNDYVTSGTFQKKVGAFWENSTEFNVTDQVRASINFANIPKSELQANGNTARLKLPEGFDCSQFKGQKYDTTDNGNKSGEYTYEQDENGLWYIVLTLDDNYVKDAGETIGGNLKLEFEWDENSGSQEGKTETISIGKWDSTVTIKKDEDKKPDETGTNFSISKNGSKLYYDQNGVGYLDYTITLKVDKDTTGPIDLTDVFEGNDWKYDSISANGVFVSWENTSTDNGATSTIHVGKEGETIKAGTYTITYRMKNDKIGDVNSAASSPVHNTISVPDGDKTIKSEKWTHMNTSTINKQGQLTQGDGKTYIDYTVYLNAGDIIKNLKNGTTFTDTLPDGVKLVGDVTVEQFDVNGKQTGSFKAQVDGKNISYTTPKGQYYYKITYRVEAESPESVPIGGLVVNNTGTSKGDINGSSSASNTIPSHYLTKEYVDQNVSQDENGKWINNMKWKSTIGFEGSLDGYIYEDWAEVVYSNILSGHTCPTTMSDAQREAIKVLDKNGNPISKDLYEITTSDHKDLNISNGLFKIIFKGNVKGPITLEYETTADLTNYTLNQDISFVNYASITKDGKGENAQASTPKFKYTHESNKIIYKYGQYYDNSGSEPSNSSITLNPGETSISWNIMLNKGGTLTGDLIVTDTIAKDLTFLKDSLKVNIQYGSDITNEVEYTYDENTQLLKITIPADCYKQNQVIIISYRTELPESFLSSSELTGTFKNTASVEQNGTKTDSTFDQTVTRKVIGKSGSYDAKNQTLTYEIIVNPDASRLNEGNTLTILDTLNAGELKGHIHLKGLTAFTALKTTDSNGNVKVEPGALIKALTQASDTASKKDFTYYWDESTEQFTAYLPDSTAYVLVAEYYIQGELSKDVSLGNSVEIQGEKTWKADDNYTTAKKDTSGETYTKKDSISIVKHDSAQYNNLLDGAEFKLEQYEDGNWIDAKSTNGLTISSTLTTGSGNNGTGKTYTAVQRNILYRLTETKAPNKYILDDTPYYFIVVTDGTTPSLPEDIKDKVNIFTVETGDDNFANVVIDRYNAYDKTTVEKGQLRVNKEWVGGDGQTVTDPTVLAKMKEVKVTLTKRVVRKGHTVILKADEYNKRVIDNLNDGCYIIIESWLNDAESLVQFEDTNMTITKSGSGPYTYKIGPILSDSTILPGNLYNNIVKMTFEGGTPPTGYDDTLISTETLNPANDWSHLWTDLETDDVISYILTEETIDGYKTTYTIDGKDLAAGDEFTLGENGSKLTVTNTADEEYQLPETGGTGTLPYTISGIILIALALLCGYSLKRRR